MFLLVMALAMMLPSRMEAHDRATSLVDVTTRTGSSAHNGLKPIKGKSSTMIQSVIPQPGDRESQTLPEGKNRDAVMKAKGQKSTAQAKAKDKRVTSLRQVGHNPKPRPGKGDNRVVRRSGEVLDADGIIIKPADGVRKVYNRAGKSLVYDPDGDSWIEVEQTGQVDIVTCDDGTVYIKDIISNYRTGAWFRGSINGNKIAIPVGGLVNYDGSYGVPFSIYWGKRDGRDFFKDDSREVITFTIDGDMISLDDSDEDNIIGVFYKYDDVNWTFDNFGDYSSVYSFDHDYVPLDVVTVTPPAGLQTATWYTRGHYYEGSSVAFRSQVEVGIDGDDVYLHGLLDDYPDGWMHGVLSDGTVTFNGLQVQGEMDGGPVYAIGYDGDHLVPFTMNYDQEAGSLTSTIDLLANGNEETVDFITWIEDVTITRDNPFKPIEDYPYLNAFQTLDEQEAFAIIDANGDGDTWDFAYDSSENWFARYTYNESFAADDWLISPAFHFEAGKQYRLTFDAWNKSADERIEVLVGSDATPDAMTIQVMDPTDIMWEEPQQLETMFTASTTGTYYIGFHAISLPDMYKLFVDNVMVDIYEVEAPAAPANLTAVQTDEVLEVTLNFTAPLTKRNGEPLEGNLDKIDLMRDGQVIYTVDDVAPGTTITCVDNDVTLGLHKYQAVAYNDKGAGDKSEVVAVRVITTIDVPYTADLTLPETFDLFTVIDANDDGSTWNWDDGNHTNYNYDVDHAADDYLVTLPVQLEAGKNYNVIVNAYNGGIDERFEVLLGTEPTVQGLTTTVIEPTDVTTDDIMGDEFEGLFSVNETGKYYLAIHAISDADLYRLMVNYLTIEFGAEPTAPAAPVIHVTADELAALQAVVTVTAPTTAVDGSQLTSNLTRIDILRDGVVVGSIEDVVPGTTVSYVDVPEVVGVHAYQAIPYNQSGKGLKSEKVKAYVGPDVPSAVENLTATDAHEAVSLNWDKVSNIGENGGPVNPATVNYMVWSTLIQEGWSEYYLEKNELLATLTDADAVDVAFDTSEGNQRLEYWMVETRNEANAEFDGLTASTGLLVGAPYQLPVNEGFAGDELHYYWETNGTIMISGQSSDQDGSSLALLSETTGQVFFNSGKLDLDGLTHPTLLFDIASPSISSITVVGSVDGGEFSVLQDNIAVNNGFTQVKVPLTDLQGGRYARIGLMAEYAEASQIDSWEGTVVSLGDLLLIDNIHIADLYQHDLSVDLNVPSTVVAGKDASITVTVTNQGENAASGFTVVLTAGDKELMNLTPNQTLAPFETWSQTSTLHTTVLDEPGDVQVVARVRYDMDQLTANNECDAVLAIVEPGVPAPTNLNVEQDGSNLLLSWTAPDAGGTMVVTEDFEDAERFPEFSLGGITADERSGAFGDWSLYDGNGLMCYGFSGFEVPNLGAPMAWMPFNVANQALPGEVASVYQPHSGNQFMISTCVSDGDPIPDTDHWLISPELTGNEQEISFFARVITDSYGDETFEVLYSTTDTDVDSFISLENMWISATSWTEFRFLLPEGTKHFAIRHTSRDVFGLLLDDVTMEHAATAPAGYNIYVDGVMVGTTADLDYVMTIADLADGKHTFAVTAIYDSGVESAPATAVLNVDSGIDEITMDGKPVDVYTIDGRLVRRQATSLEGLKGLYLIGNKKVYVK